MADLSHVEVQVVEDGILGADRQLRHLVVEYVLLPSTCKVHIHSTVQCTENDV